MSSLIVDGRFTDQWVVDRTLFEHLSGGSCSCCGLAHHNVGALMQNCSDVETDDGRKERKSPWPPAMSDEVWTARVKLRALMKEDMPQYKQKCCINSDLTDPYKKCREFWDKHGCGFIEWWIRLPMEQKRRTLSVPVDEVLAILEGKYDIRGAYSEVMCAVNEQLRNFNVTGIKDDGRTSAELSFERFLNVHRGAYIGSAFLKDEYAHQLFEMCQQVGGPRLLPSKHDRHNSGASAPKSIGKEVESTEMDPAPTEVQSFRADRRLIRLLSFRYMFDKAIRKYREGIRDGEAGEAGPSLAEPTR